MFRSKVLGEFWYDVDATCDAAAAESVPEMRSEIGGRRDRKALEVANPTDREIALASPAITRGASSPSRRSS